MSAVGASHVSVVGAGLAGLAAATHLHRSDVPVTVYEASDDVGGRVRTDVQEGFLLDRGFQVFLDSYRHAREILDLPSLRLSRFEPGALIFHGGRFHRVTDPARRPGGLWSTLRAPIGSLRHKLRILRMKRVSRDAASPAADEPSAAELLARLGIEGDLLERFVRPFFSGVMLDRELRVSGNFFRFIYDRFARGHATLPAEGMGAIPAQLAGGLPDGTVRLGARVTRAGGGLRVGDEILSKLGPVVVATDPWSDLVRDGNTLEPLGVTTLYFATDSAPIEEPLIALDGAGTGPVTNLCVPSIVAPTYAPPGSHLVSASVVGTPGEPDLLARVREQLSGWFGVGAVADWTHLRTYRIPEALPLIDRWPRSSASAAEDGRCGDYTEHASIEGALVSGTRAAAHLLPSQVVPV